MHQPVLLSIQVGLPAEHGTEGAADPMDRPWTNGYVKTSVAGPTFLGRTNLDGDGQADLVNHGGPDKAVCAYPDEHYNAWRAELDLTEMPYGAFGENFTIGGLAEDDICIGDVWRVGEATALVAQHRWRCWKLARHWRTKDLAGRVARPKISLVYSSFLQRGRSQLID